MKHAYLDVQDMEHLLMVDKRHGPLTVECHSSSLIKRLFTYQCIFRRFTSSMLLAGNAAYLQPLQYGRDTVLPVGTGLVITSVDSRPQQLVIQISKLIYIKLRTKFTYGIKHQTRKVCYLHCLMLTKWQIGHIPQNMEEEQIASLL